MYSDGLNNLIAIGMVTATNRNDNDDDVNVVYYAMNLRLSIVSND